MNNPIILLTSPFRVLRQTIEKLAVTLTCILADSKIVNSGSGSTKQNACPFTMYILFFIRKGTSYLFVPFITNGNPLLHLEKAHCIPFQ